MFKHNEYRITFQHHEAPCFNGITRCSIYLDSDGKDAEPLVVGEARCSLKDNFNRTTGRELAFARAIQQLKGKADRLEFWKAFWCSCDGHGTEGAAVAYLNGVISPLEYYSRGATL